MDWFRQQAGADLGILTCFEDMVTTGMRNAAASTGLFMQMPWCRYTQCRTNSLGGVPRCLYLSVRLSSSDRSTTRLRNGLLRHYPVMGEWFGAKAARFLDSAPLRIGMTCGEGAHEGRPYGGNGNGGPGEASCGEGGTGGWFETSPYGVKGM